MTLYAWVGLDEGGSGVEGIKQIVCPTCHAFGMPHEVAGRYPLVCIEEQLDVLRGEKFLEQLQAQATAHGRTIRLVAFDAGAAIHTITP